MIAAYGAIQYHAVKRYKQLAATYKTEAQSYRSNIALREPKPKETVMIMPFRPNHNCRQVLRAFADPIKKEKRKGTWTLQDKGGFIYWQSSTPSTYETFVYSFPDGNSWTTTTTTILTFQPA
jgi:hypothetical protein